MSEDPKHIHETSDKSSKKVATQRPNVCSARSLRSERSRAKLGRYVATESPFCSVATQRPNVCSARSLRSERARAKPGRSRSIRSDRARSQARSLRRDRAFIPLGRYVATESPFAWSLCSDRARALPKRRYDISPCILVYPSMLSPEDRSEPISCFSPF
ncbi:hypothetical protein F2Q68_00034619 [Brassica cretica]|uniref:Uncharacterized protein n=1 Tax=Brassica cretica TaxID=69181 RepID=A0A8S9H1U9_BRACR|nr:hypothetical protein F2Q68_00034619 [Brassica cretica]